MLDAVAGYVPGEQLNRPDIIKLNTNENPYPPSPRVLRALREVDGEMLRKYPDPLARAFRRACAERYACPDESWVIAGNGMDELLSIAVRVFVEPGSAAIAPYPTYTLYDVLLRLHGARLTYLDLDESFRLTEAHFSAKGPLFFLTRPNAPTGVSCPRAEVERLCASFPGIVLIDEAYVDFADDSCMDLPLRYPNAVVMRTFSKSFSLAGMRIGVAVARPEIIGAFLKMKDSYNLDVLSQMAGLAAMEDYDYMRHNANRVREERSRLRAALLDLGFEVPESQSNFLLARWTRSPGAKTLHEQLRDRGILVRYFGERRLEDRLRITVGSAGECAALVNALRELTA
jgi:histidinol-phosphate aminotransferase